MSLEKFEKENKEATDKLIRHLEFLFTNTPDVFKRSSGNYELEGLTIARWNNSITIYLSSVNFALNKEENDRINKAIHDGEKIKDYQKQTKVINEWLIPRMDPRDIVRERKMKEQNE